MKLLLTSFFFFLTFVLNAQEQPKAVICEWEQDITDEFSGKKKLALKPRKFFGYCPEGSGRFFQEKEYLECWGSLVKQDNKTALNLNIQIQDDKAPEQMGKIPPNAVLEIRSVKGKTIYLKTFAGAEAELKSKLTNYNCSFFIPEKTLKKLKNFEVDSVKLNWSKGFQVYTVYYMDFFAHQMLCFE